MLVRYLLLTAIVVADTASAQHASSRSMQWCGAMNCEEQVIRTVALDSTIQYLLQTNQIARDSVQVLASLHVDPFRVRDGSVLVDRLGNLDWAFLRRIYPHLVVVDSVAQAFSSSGVLRVSGPLFVLAPVSWRGDSAAVVRLALFPRPRAFSSELYVRLEYRDARWTVVRIEYGRQE